MGNIKKIKMRTFILLLALCAIASATPLRQIMTNFSKATHYKQPAPSGEPESKDYHECTGYNEGTLAQNIDGLYPEYWACMPEPIGDDGICPGDYPMGNTTVPAPVYKGKNDKKKEAIYCALVCQGRAIGICAPGAECVTPAGMAVGICAYPKIP